MPWFDGFEVSGSPAFEYRTRQAIEILGDSEAFSSVRPSLHAIREGRCSGLVVERGKTIFDVGCRTWHASLTWYASAIVHDSGHAHLYWKNQRKLFGFRYTPRSAWTGIDAERLCLRLQLSSLRSLRAGRDVIRYVESLLTHPNYQNEPDRTW